MSKRVLFVCLFVLLPAAVLGQVTENETRGFSPDKLYDFGDVDAINTFNGNLTVTIPIGGQYPVNSTFSYGLAAVYNAQVWDYDERVTLNEGTFISPVPSDLWNAGLGWVVGFGRLFPPEGLEHQPINDTKQWVYFDPSGNKHHFYDDLHADIDEDDMSATTFYSRDNSYLRMKLDSVTNPTSITIEFPDGRVHTFEDQHGLGWYPVELVDAYGNDVQIDYGANAPASTWDWEITDKHGRLQTVSLESHPVLGFIVDVITLEAFGGASAVYDFAYTSDGAGSGTGVDLCYKNTDEETPPNVIVPLLTSIVLPAGAGSYSFGDVNAPDYHTSGCNGQLPGALLAMQLPTGGSIEWDYGSYLMPAERGGSASSGVVVRRTMEENGTTEGEWFYTNEAITYPDPIPPGSGLRETRTHVTFPTGDCTLNYFTADPDPDWQFGLPYSKNEDGVGDLKISTEVLTSNTGGNKPKCSGTVLRTTYVEYENDLFVDGGNDGELDRYNTNRRLITTRTVYNDDPVGSADRFAETAMADFDGLGHYRESVTTGNFISGNDRELFTSYNPDQGTFNPNNDPDSPKDSFTMIPVIDPWVLGTFEERRTMEFGDTSKEQFCFEASTGFLEWKRTLVDSQNTGNDDLVSFFERSGTGNLTSERYYGGDISTAPSVNCGDAAPPGDDYHRRHSYQFGVLKLTHYRDANDISLGFRTVDRDIDVSTGLIEASRDIAGIDTDFTYDDLGRILSASPESGHGAQTIYLYTAASNGDPAEVRVTQIPNNGGAGIARTTVEFDDFGRVNRERRLMPTLITNTRLTEYNARGWKTAVSETESLYNPASKTLFLNYDPFGRPGLIRAPDHTPSNPREVTLEYTGVSKVERTVNIQPGFLGGNDIISTTAEEFDRQGRLYRVTEPSGPAQTMVPTTYGYDEGNRLSTVAINDGATNQQRFFNYDNRGFLVSESHPEKTASPEDVRYFSYDARGHVGRKLDGTFGGPGVNDLNFFYDRAERLVRVEDRVAGNRTVKEFVYATDNDPGTDYRLGKLLSATRHNYVEFFSDVDIAIQETYTYGGVGGRVSKRVTSRGDEPFPLVPFFEQRFTWTDLGNLESQTYPICLKSPECDGGGSGEPSRVLTHTYDQGFLTNIDEGATSHASLTYHPNEMIAQIMHGNGVNDIWDMDPDSMRRPRRIRTQGVSGTNFDTGTYLYDGAGNISQIGANDFGYDAVSRLVYGEASQGQVVEENQYDAFGNRVFAKTSEGIGSRYLPTDPTTNRLQSTPARTITYDDRGNLTHWGTAVYSYDPFDMQRQHVDTGVTPQRSLSYLYTADDERIITFDNAPPNENWTIRDLDGKVVRNYFRAPGHVNNWLKDFVHRQGQVLATDSPEGFEHAHVDHLGTVRGWTDAAQAIQHRTYYPFGEEITPALTQELEYTGHERDNYASGGDSCEADVLVIDNETINAGATRVGCDEISSENTTVSTSQEVNFFAGDLIALGNGFEVGNNADFEVTMDGTLNSDLQDLDYMHARFCSPGLGRFLSVDPVRSGVPAAPQTWNRFAYGLGNPVTYSDPDGQFVVTFSALLITATAISAAAVVVSNPLVQENAIAFGKTIESKMDELLSSSRGDGVEIPDAVQPDELVETVGDVSSSPAEQDLQQGLDATLQGVGDEVDAAIAGALILKKAGKQGKLGLNELRESLQRFWERFTGKKQESDDPRPEEQNDDEPDPE